MLELMLITPSRDEATRWPPGRPVGLISDPGTGKWGSVSGAWSLLDLSRRGQLDLVGSCEELVWICLRGGNWILLDSHWICLDGDNPIESIIMIY